MTSKTEAPSTLILKDVLDLGPGTMYRATFDGVPSYTVNWSEYIRSLRSLCLGILGTDKKKANLNRGF